MSKTKFHIHTKLQANYNFAEPATGIVGVSSKRCSRRGSVVGEAYV
jgi:hypothetical protein